MLQKLFNKLLLILKNYQLIIESMENKIKNVDNVNDKSKTKRVSSPKTPVSLRTSTENNDNIIVDNGGPSITLARSSSSTRYSIKVDVTTSDSLTSINKSCSSDRDALTGLIWDGEADGSQSFTESSLNCGTSYTYK